MLLAIVIPVFNESRLLRACIERLLSTPAPPGCERLVVLVDDGSTDGSRPLVESFRGTPGFEVVIHAGNRGKGAAVRTGIEAALGRGAGAVLIHDADLEYDPADHAPACEPVLQGRADVVIGTRFAHGTPRGSSPFHRLVNAALTAMSNAITGLGVSDMECCTKVFTADVLRRVRIEEDRFGLEPELVAKVARLRLPDGEGRSRPVRVAQVPVSYAGRDRSQGKKIGWTDGFRAMWCIVRYGLAPGRGTALGQGGPARHGHD